MILTFLLLSFASLIWLSLSYAQEPVLRARSEISIPDVPGFVTLNRNYHIHTVFSDGSVFPAVQTKEVPRVKLEVET